MGKFQDLKVWQRAKDLAVYIYKLTNKTPFSKDFGLRDQIRKAAISIPSNIAEGDELGSNKQAIRHFYIAKGLYHILHPIPYTLHPIPGFNHLPLPILHKSFSCVSYAG